MPGKTGIRLTDRQRDAIIGSIYEAALKPRQWGRVLLDIGKPVNAHAAQLVTVSDDPADLLDNVLVGVDLERAATEFEELVAQGEHPRVNYASSVSELTSVYDYMHTSERAMQTDQCYQEHFRPLDVPYYVATPLIHGQDRFTVVGHFRTAQYGHFDTEEITYLNQLALHLRRSLELSRRLPKQGAIRGMEAILEHMKCPTAIIDAQLNLVGANDKFLRLIDEEDALSLRERKLRLIDEANTVKLQREIRSTLTAPFKATTQRHCPTVLNPRSGINSHELMLVPLSPELSLHKKSLGLLIAINPRQSLNIPPSYLRREYNLTEAESDVASFLADGKSIRSIARIRDSRIETVRSQVKSILGKTSTSRQAELVALLYRRFAAEILLNAADTAVDRAESGHS